MNEERSTVCLDTPPEEQAVKTIRYEPLFPPYENPKSKITKSVLCVNIIYIVGLLSIVYSHSQKGINWGFMIDVPFEILIATGIRQFILWMLKKRAIERSEKYDPQEITRNKRKNK